MSAGPLQLVPGRTLQIGGSGPTTFKPAYFATLNLSSDQTPLIHLQTLVSAGSLQLVPGRALQIVAAVGFLVKRQIG